MSNIVFLNGEYLKEDEAKVSVFDRGYMFGDGVYEVVPVVNYTVLDKEPFLERFTRSLAELELDWPMSPDAFLIMIDELIKRNDIKEGGVYMQVTRGVAPRDFSYPKDTPTTCTAFAFSKNVIDNPQAQEGLKVVTVEDIRWKRRDVKSIALLGQCVAKQEAKKKGAYEGWMVEDGFVTEGTSSTAYIVKDNVIITRPLSNSILPGIRRKLLIEIAKEHDVKIEERLFTVEEALNADEAFLSSATTFVLPIIEIDGKKIGNGKPGPVAKKMREMYIASALDIAGVKL
ncbi:D-amino-acid transaminase [Sulfurospirillum arcachonense]|uniref:D-amino-acid transaminase n=1 Tax=Sulfurospirillum arcachonense TaxID=57666 RepID=UPI0004682796|nr:D-amino-acid transaminase [Sulfurospirillum arcachonense]